MSLAIHIANVSRARVKRRKQRKIKGGVAMLLADLALMCGVVVSLGAIIVLAVR